MILSPGKLQATNNREKPLNATNVELVKKVSIRSPQGKGKPSRTVATGILGENRVRATSINCNRYFRSSRERV